MDPNKIETEGGDSDSSSEFNLLSSESDSSDFKILSSSSDSSSSTEYEGNGTGGKTEPRKKTIKLRSFKLTKMPGFSPKNTKITSSLDSKKEDSKKPSRMLTKRRSFKSSKGSSRNDVVELAAGMPESSLNRATCSSALKNPKLRRKIGQQQQRGESESQLPDMKVCRYSYCSLHGHRHGNSQPLKRIVSMRRRIQKNQKSIKSESRSVTKVKQISDRRKKNTENKKEEPVITINRDESIAGDSPEVEDSIQEEVNGKKENESRKKGKYGGLWSLVYQHMKSGVALETEMGKENQINDNNTSSPVSDSLSRQSSLITDQETGIRDGDMDRQKFERSKGDAVKLVQEAFDKILSEIPDQFSDDQSISSDLTLEQESVTQSPEEKPIEDIDVSMNISEEEKGMSKKEGNRSRENVLKNWSNLRKVIMFRRFVSALENVRKIDNWRKPRYLSAENEEEDEKVKLRRQITGQNRNMDEWMLDYALRKVISQLAPVQKKKVATLVQAFETLSPSTDVPIPKKFSATDSDSLDRSSSLTDDDRSDSVDSFSVTRLELSDATCTNCCLHGHLHGNLQPTKRVVSMRRRSFRTQTMKRLTNRRKGSTKKKKESEKVASNADARDAKPAIAGDGDEPKKNGERVEDTGVDHRLLQGFSSSRSSILTNKSQKPQIEKQMHGGLWGLIYQRMASGIADEAEKQPPVDSKNNKEEIRDDQSKADAVQIVKEAFDKILSEIPDNSSDDRSSISSDATPEQENVEQQHPEEKQIEAYNINAAGKERGLTAEGKNFSQNASKNWSNMRKLVMLRRFVKAIEKVKNVKSWKPARHLPLGPESEAELVNLRRQSIGQGKNPDEWMLDYALRQVISELAPAQKQKVALLVQAFETVSPVLEVGTPKSFRSNATESDDGDSNSVLSDYQSDSIDLFHSNKPSSKPDDSKSTSGEGLLKTLQDSFKEVISNSKPVACDRDIKFSSGRLDTFDAIRLGNNPDKKEPRLSAKPSPNTDEMRSNRFSWGRMDIGKSVNAAGEQSLKPKTSNPENSAESDVVIEASSGKKSELENHKYKGLWYLIHKHMESTTAEGGIQQNLESEDNLSETNEKMVTEERGKEDIDAIKLIEEAIDGINLPEGQEDSPDDQSIKSNDEKVEEAETASELESKAKPRMQKNWSNLKKVILLNRFIKSLEKVKKINPRGPRYLPDNQSREAEKVNLRRQNIGDRKYGEDWMLDHALQEVVSQLTPARKRKVELLVEAFETVTPTN